MKGRVVMYSETKCRQILLSTFVFFLMELFLITALLSAQDFFPFQSPQGHIRIVSWNIEFLGKRKPRRTQEQKQAIAERIRTFDAAVLVLQEILKPAVLDDIKTALGPSWKIHASWWQNNAFLYDTNKVKMLSLEYLKHRKQEKGSTKTKWPGTWYRKPISGVFRPLDIKAKAFPSFFAGRRLSSYAAQGKWGHRECFRKTFGLCLCKPVPKGKIEEKILFCHSSQALQRESWPIWRNLQRSFSCFRRHYFLNIRLNKKQNRRNAFL